MRLPKMMSTKKVAALLERHGINVSEIVRHKVKISVKDKREIINRLETEGVVVLSTKAARSKKGWGFVQNGKVKASKPDRRGRHLTPEKARAMQQKAQAVIRAKRLQAEALATAK